MNTEGVASESPQGRTAQPVLANSSDRVVTRLAPLFFVSGVAALVYQVCWQRLLFSAFGVDIDSVTIIVSVFMLGLGLGALAFYLADAAACCLRACKHRIFYVCDAVCFLTG